MDVRPDEHIEPDDAEAFAATARACELAGWTFRRMGAIDPVLLANIKWLAGYRHPRNHGEPAASELAAVFAEPGALLAGAERVGDRLAVLQVPITCSGAGFWKSAWNQGCWDRVAWFAGQ